MRRPSPSSTDSLTLAAICARLAAHPAVDGLLTLGSTATEALEPTSDYDLVVVLNAAPVLLRVALTTIEQRLTDVIFLLAAELPSAEMATPPHPIWEPAQVQRWLREGRLIFDRTGQIAQATARAQAIPEVTADEAARYAAQFSINYNLQQSRRMRLANDQHYQTAVDLRLLFSLHDLWRYYFVMRQLPVYGEKAQSRYLAEHDPEYLAAFRACLHATDRNDKFHRYEGLAERTLAPSGPLWVEGVTAVLPVRAEAWAADSPAVALAYWQQLIRQEAGS